MQENNKITNWFKQITKNKPLINDIKKIKLIIIDIDGALTDGNVEYIESREGGRRFSTQDGFTIKKALAVGLIPVFVSGKKHPSAEHRAEILGMPKENCITGLAEKPSTVEMLQKKFSVTPEQTLIWGDDFLDAEIKLKNPSSLFATPKNAPFYIQNMANIVVPKEGGDHAFRLLLDLVLYVQEKHFAQELITKTLT